MEKSSNNNYKLTPLCFAKFSIAISLLATPSLWANDINSPPGLRLPSLFHIKTSNVFINWNGNKANQVCWFQQHIPAALPPTWDTKLFPKSLLTVLRAAHPQLTSYPGQFNTFHNGNSHQKAGLKAPCLAETSIHSTYKQVMPLSRVTHSGDAERCHIVGAEG